MVRTLKNHFGKWHPAFVPCERKLGVEVLVVTSRAESAGCSSMTEGERDIRQPPSWLFGLAPGVGVCVFDHSSPVRLVASSAQMVLSAN